MITFEEFEEIINFLKGFEERGVKIDELLSMDSDFYVNLVSGITSKHESIIVKLLNKIFNLEYIPHIGTDLDYWIYDLEFGEKWTEGCISDCYGNNIKIQTTREIYDYLVGEEDV